MDALDPQNHQKLTMPIPQIGDELIINGHLTKLTHIVEPDGVFGTMLWYSRDIPAGVEETCINIQFKNDI